jgi:CHAT domain-containing protein
VTLLEGRDATEPRVTAAAAGKAIVHFATHAIVRDEAPNESYLAFGPGGDSTTGLLTAREVYGLRLNADLVVLSACRSGGGRVTGDGIATFARAFLYAGTPSLVVSLWDVADEPASRLLPAFYGTWLGGASKARSLRRAQLRLLADLRAGTVRVDTRAGPVVLPEHPMFWAGFVLIGEPE